MLSSVRNFATKAQKMSASVGSKFPSVTLFENTPGGEHQPNDVMPGLVLRILDSFVLVRFFLCRSGANG